MELSSTLKKSDIQHYGRDHTNLKAFKNNYIPIPRNNYDFEEMNTFNNFHDNKSKTLYITTLEFLLQQKNQKIQIINNFAQKLIEETIPYDNEIAEIVNDNFWDLIKN